jgi:hypothetical protein
MTPASHSRTPLVETVVGRLLEWMVISVEEIRERLHRGGSR